MDVNAVVSSKRPTGSATVADLLALPEGDRFELVDGELVRKEAGNGRHGQTQISLGILLRGHRGGGGGGRGPGGWIFGSEVLVEFSGSQVRMPDVAGWRRGRLPEMPKDAPVKAIPDWICEILSTNRADDLVAKMRLHHASRGPHCWTIDTGSSTPRRRRSLSSAGRRRGISTSSGRRGPTA